MSERQGHGWWPYVVPYFAFLGAVEVSGRLPESFAPVMLFVKPAVPALLLCWFASRGAYRELRGFSLRPSGILMDVAVGLALAVLWMAPFVLFPAIRPEPGGGFDAAILGTERSGLALAVRMLGYAIVTPVFEELFIRSFVMRYAEVYNRRGDFRDVPLAHFTWRSFITTIVVFTVGHVPWEWWVAIPWVALTNLWFYHRRHLMAVIVVHGVTNAAILVLAILGSGWFHDELGEPLSLWFFV